MRLAHDTEIALVTTASLVNTSMGGSESLATPRDLTAFLAQHEVSGHLAVSETDLASVWELRAHLRGLWDVSTPEEVARLLNEVLDRAGAAPYLTQHDWWNWHLHYAKADAPIIDRLAAELAMGLADLVRLGEFDRLGTCVASDCDAVLVDLSKNKSRLYCDTGNCGNRAHAAAYRARSRAHA